MDNKINLKTSKAFFDLKETYQIRDFDRKKELMQIRFDLAIKLVELLDKVAEKRQVERCQLLGIKYIPENRQTLTIKK